MEKKELSEEAKWCLRGIQLLQDDFASAVGAQIVMTDKEGNLITKMSGQQRVCQLIMGTEEGKKECEICYNSALNLVRTQKEPLFVECWAGFASLWVPITVEGEVVGSITGCGGRFSEGKKEEDLREYYLKLAEKLKIENKEDFLKAAIEEITPVTKEEMKKRAEMLAKLVSILIKETALKEVFKR